MDICFVLWVIMSFAIFTFIFAEIIPDLANGRFFHLASVSFQCVPAIFWAFPYILVLQNVPASFFLLKLPQPWNQPFFQGSPDPFYWIMVFRSQGVGAWCAHGYWGVVGSIPSQQTKLRRRCIYTQMYIHVFIYLLSISLCVYLYLRPQNKNISLML